MISVKNVDFAPVVSSRFLNGKRNSLGNTTMLLFIGIFVFYSCIALPLAQDESFLHKNFKINRLQLGKIISGSVKKLDAGFRGA